MESDVVDIIIPAHNPGSYIIEAIESCLKQSYKRIKITVIDDCSTQDLSFLKKKYPQISLLRTPKNLGPGGARNFGMKETSGGFISFLDSDDIMDKDKIFLSLKEFEKDNSIGLVCGNYKIFVNRSKIKSAFYKKAPAINWKTLMERNWIASGSVTIKRKVFEEIGGFDERFWICEDYDYWLRISEKYSIKYINRVLYLYSVCPGNNSLTQRKDIQTKHLENIKIIKKESEQRIRKENESRASSKYFD